MVPMIKTQIETLKAPAGDKHRQHGETGDDKESDAVATNDQGAVAKRLDRLEHLMQEVSDRLKTIETRLPSPKQ